MLSDLSMLGKNRFLKALHGIVASKVIAEIIIHFAVCTLLAKAIPSQLNARICGVFEEIWFFFFSSTFVKYHKRIKSTMMLVHGARKLHICEHPTGWMCTNPTCSLKIFQWKALVLFTARVNNDTSNSNIKGII